METNGQKETENRIDVSHHNMGTVNKNRVTITTHRGSVTLYFSYKTLVAVNRIVSKNEWSRTTGRFLGELQPYKSMRVPYSEV